MVTACLIQMIRIGPNANHQLYQSADIINL